MRNWTESLKQLAQNEYRKTSWEHGWPHVERVAGSAKELARRVAISEELCAAAAYCHDLGRVVETAAPSLGNTYHAVESIPPTIEFLKKAGANDSQISIVVGAVAVHSDRMYFGKNPVAKVLRDADKKDALGPWGTLRCFKHHFKRDIVGTDKIIENTGNYQELKKLAQETALVVKAEKELFGTYINNLNFVLEWFDANMLDNAESYDFLKEDYEFSLCEREMLLSNNLNTLCERSRQVDRQRATHFFHDPKYKGSQFGINVIQPNSYIRPHARQEPEKMISLKGQVCSLQFDEQGKIIRRAVIDKNNPFLEIPGGTFQTVVSLQPDSAIGVTIQGPLRDDYREDAIWAPSEAENYRDFFARLKSLT